MQKAKLKLCVRKDLKWQVMQQVSLIAQKKAIANINKAGSIEPAFCFFVTKALWKN